MAKMAEPIRNKSDLITGFGLGCVIAGYSTIIVAIVAICKRTLQALKGHEYTIGIGGITGLTTFVAVPLSKKFLHVCPPPVLRNQENHHLLNEPFYRGCFVAGANFITMFLFANRITLLIRGAPLSSSLHLSWMIFSGLFSGGAFLALQKRRSIEVITRRDWRVAASSGALSFAQVMGVPFTVIIFKLLFSYLSIYPSAGTHLSKWGWNCIKEGWINHPRLKGIIATAMASIIGYKGGQVVTGSDRIANYVASIFGILLAPFFARYCFNHTLNIKDSFVSLSSVLAIKEFFYITRGHLPH